MISFLNRKMRGFLVVILVLVAVSFIFFVDFAPTAAFGPRNLGKIQGESISRADFQSFFRETEISFVLTTGQTLSSFPGMEDMMVGETWNRLITLKAAEEAGIEVTADEITDFITAHPLFQENGVYSPNRFRMFTKRFFDPPGVQISDGMNLENFERTIRHQIMIEKFNDLLQSPATATPDDVDDYLTRLHGSATVKTATLSRNQIEKNLIASDEELKAFHQQNINQYLTPEQRRVQYVLFELEKDWAEDSPERASAMRRLGEQAFQFSDPFYHAQQAQTPMPDFSEQAAKAKLEVKETPLFAADASPKPFGDSSPVARIAFGLTSEAPISDAIELKNGYAVIALKDIKPAEPLPFEKVQAEVRTQFRQQETTRQLRIKGEEAAANLAKLIEKEIPWKEAVTEAGLQPGKELNIIPADLERESPELEQNAARTITNMEPGSVSSFRPTSDGGVVFFLEQRTPPTEETLRANRESARFQLTARQGASLVREWVQSQYSAPGTELPMMNQTPGS